MNASPAGAMPHPTLEICETRDGVSARAAQMFTETMQAAIAQRGRGSVALSGGSTPKVIYELLATPAWSAKNDWQKIHLIWGDERAVPKDHADSNYRMVKQALLDKIAIPEANVHRVRTELGPQKAAEDYEKMLRAFFPGEAWPPIDLMLLGLGENGHTASLFPHIQMLHEQKKWVAAEYIEEVKMDRISLTAPAIDHARKTVFLISGKSKAEVVRDVLHGKYQPEQLPSQLIHPNNGPYIWLLDRDAAALVSK